MVEDATNSVIRPKRLLVVEDEAALRRLFQAYLVRLGYQVETFSGAAEALEAFSRRPGEYDLVLADLHLEGMSGFELIERVVRLNPEVRILVCSGEAFDRRLLPAGVRDQVGLLQKPFLPKMLMAEVERLLDSPSPRR